MANFIGFSDIPKTSVTWAPVVINGGGQSTGFSIAADGTVICRNDTGGAYKWSGSRWSPLSTAAQLSFPDFNGYRGQTGCTDAQIAPSDSSIIYQFLNGLFQNNRNGAGYLYKSTNGGTSFTPTNYPANTALDGDGELVFRGDNLTYKRVANKIAIDPINPNVVYASNPGRQPLVTVDGGTTWTNVPNLPISGYIGACCWTFDPSGGTVGDKTKNIYVAVESSGVWFSSNAGVSFTLLSASFGFYAPTNAGVDASDGTFYIVDAPIASTYGYRLNKYASGSWTTTAINDSSSRVFMAAHPSISGTICAVKGNIPSHLFWYSSDHGVTWVSYSNGAQTFSSNGAEAPWWANQMGGFLLASVALVFNPHVTGELWYCLGQGMCRTTISANTSTVAPIWTSVMAGVEQVVVECLVHESGTPLLQVVEDLVMFIRPTNALSTPPTNTTNISTGGAAPLALGNGWSAAIDKTNTNNMVLSAINRVGSDKYYGYSQNGGSTWTPFSTLPEADESTSNPSEILLSNGVILYLQCPDFSSVGFEQESYWSRSTDWGATWTRLKGGTHITGTTIPASGYTGWGSGHGEVPCVTGCVDGLDPSTFYFYNNNFGTTPDCRGMFKSTDGGITFAYQGSGASDPFSAYTGFNLSDLRAVPGVSGVLFAASGYVSSDPHPNAAFTFRKSTNGGASWSTVANVLEVNRMTFGKAGPSGNPTLFIAGFYKNVYGIYMSVDLGANWQQLVSSTYGTCPITNCAVFCMEGDKDVFGRVYIGTHGTGTVYSTLA